MNPQMLPWLDHLALEGILQGMAYWSGQMQSMTLLTKLVFWPKFFEKSQKIKQSTNDDDMSKTPRKLRGERFSCSR
jgi:hypothetical protein